MFFMCKGLMAAGTAFVQFCLVVGDWLSLRAYADDYVFDESSGSQPWLFEASEASMTEHGWWFIVCTLYMFAWWRKFQRINAGDFDFGLSGGQTLSQFFVRTFYGGIAVCLLAWCLSLGMTYGASRNALDSACADREQAITLDCQYRHIR